MKEIFLVACAARKLDRAAPARDLYTSALFQKSRAYAERKMGEWYILSAKHGLVRPDEIIEPYNVTLNKMSLAERRRWSKGVFDGLRDIIEPGDAITILAGRKYREFLIEPIKAMKCPVRIPLAGLGIGEQLKWLKEHNRRSSDEM